MALSHVKISPSLVSSSLSNNIRLDISSPSSRNGDTRDKSFGNGRRQKREVTAQGGKFASENIFVQGCHLLKLDQRFKTRDKERGVMLTCRIWQLQPALVQIIKLYRIPDPQDPKSGSFAHFGSLGSKIPGLLAKRPSKRPEKDPKNQFTGPDFENPESNRGSRVLILRIRYSSTNRRRTRKTT